MSEKSHKLRKPRPPKLNPSVFRPGDLFLVREPVLVKRVGYNLGHEDAVKHVTAGIIAVCWTKWGQREGVLSAIQRDARSRDRSARSAKEKVLRLVIIEDESVEVT